LKRKKSGVEISHHRAERLFLKLSLGSIVVLVLLILGIWGGHDIYVRWQEKRLVRRAELALNQGDARTASLATRAILQLRPDSTSAARIAGELAERVGDRTALSWRRKVVQTEGHSAEDVLAWARCALQFDDVATAQLALSQVDETVRKTAGFHAVAALLAQAQNDGSKAETEWTEAVRLAPDEKAYQLQLGAAHLRATDSAKRSEGATIMGVLRTDPKYRAAATRTLINEGIARREPAAKMLELARELQGYPEATFHDRVLFLDLLRQVNDSQFTANLTELEKSAVKRRGDLAELLSWMSQVGLNVLAVDYIRTLPAEMLEQWPIPLTVADIYVRLKDWAKLERVTKSGNWHDFDFVRRAYLARALRGEDKAAEAEREWTVAMKGAATSSDHMLMLIRTVSGWGWENEAVEMMWGLAKHPEKQKDALQDLYRYYAKHRDTPGLYRVLARLAEINPENLDVQNNLAQVSLLLDAKPDQARRIAADTYHKMPSNAAYAATYAYSLLTKGDATAAGKVMSSLTEKQLQDPSVSAYYGMCLAALKDPRARQFLDAGESASLLPEEKSQLEKARSELEEGARSN
jgi:tetratricopeptide (TPR) repeat protein